METEGTKSWREEAEKPLFRETAAPAAHASWATAGQLMVADIVGVGVLTLATAMASLGWVLGPILVLLFFPLNWYTGILLWRVRLQFPQSVTFLDMALATSGKRWSIFAASVVYIQIFCVLGDYVLVVGQTLGLFFYDVYWCKPVWILIGCFCLLPLNQLRLLNDTRWLCWVNMLTITLAVFISLGYLVSIGTTAARGGATTHVGPKAGVMTFATAVSKLAFAYAGQFLYLEIMSEMKKPEDFPKAFRISGPYQIFMYMVVACIGYAYKGDKASGMLIDYIPFNGWLRLAAGLLFLHMLITYLIKGSVMSRAIHLYIWPAHVNERNVRAALEWLFITTLVMGGCFMISNLIPFFESLTGLIGASVVPIACWILPVIFYYNAMKIKNRPIPTWELALMAFVFLLGVLLIVTGMISNIKDIADSSKHLGKPFSCHCDGLWNTCQCSASHTGMQC